jgi:archease protein family (MTH1598/TM1083)
VPAAGKIRRAFESEGIPCIEIGGVECGPPRVWEVCGGRRSRLKPPLRNELARVFDAMPIQTATIVDRGGGFEVLRSLGALRAPSQFWHPRGWILQRGCFRAGGPRADGRGGRPPRLTPKQTVRIARRAPDDELLLVDWLNALIFEMATRQMLFGRFEVQLVPRQLEATAWGELVEASQHQPAVEPKGATYAQGSWQSLFVNVRAWGTCLPNRRPTNFHRFNIGGQNGNLRVATYSFEP